MLYSQSVLEGASSATTSTSTRSEVDSLQRRELVEGPGADHTQIVVELHRAVSADKSKAAGVGDSAAGIRSSAPELHLLASARTSDTPRRRQFVVVAVCDDASTQPGVHASCAVRRCTSCVLPSETRATTTAAAAARRFVISLTNLHSGKVGGDVVIRQRQLTPTRSTQPATSTVAPGRRSDQPTAASVAPSSLVVSPRRSSNQHDWREMSKDLWSLRALLANHEDISIDESMDESAAAATPVTTTTATTPQSADDVSVKSSADTVISVDDRPPPETPAAAAVADPGVAAAAAPASGEEEGLTRKPSIRRQNYREAIARRQNHRLQTAAAAAAAAAAGVSNELAVPTSSLEASSEPTDTESSLSFDRCGPHPSSTASSVDTTASSFCDSLTSTDSTPGGSGSDGHGSGHRLEHLRGDSGYRSLEAQQSLGQVRDFRRQSASHSLLDSSANVIYEDQMVAPPGDDVRAPASSSSVVVSVQQTAAVSIPLSAATADPTAAPARSGHRHNKAAQRKRIQYRCERQAVEIHDSVAVGDPVDYKATHRSHRHHHHQQQQQAVRRSPDAEGAMESWGERGPAGSTATTTTTKPSLFSRLLRTTHVGSSSGGAAAAAASRRHSLARMQRDYSIDERSNAIFNEFLRHDPAYDTKQTLSVHARSSRSAAAARRSRAPRSSTSRSARRHVVTVAAAEALSADGRGSHTAPSTAAASPLFVRKHLLVEALADPRLSRGPSPVAGRRRSEGSSGGGLATDDVVVATIRATVDDRRRRSSTPADQSPSDSRPSSSGTDPTAADIAESFPTRLDDPGSDVGDERQEHVTTGAQQRRTGATSRSIPVIQLTTDEDTLP